MKAFDEGFAQTIGIYARKADDVDAGRLKLLPDAPNHVPVLAKDLRYLCELASEAQALRVLDHHVASASAARERALLEKLVSGIDQWARQEDGVPEEMFDAYMEARSRLGWADPDGKLNARAIAQRDRRVASRSDPPEPCAVCGQPASNRCVSEEGVLYFCGACAPASLDP